MDPLRIHAYKIHAIKKHKRQQFVGTILLYSLTALACTLFCSSPLWYPPFCATFNVIFFLTIPKICSFFFTSKVLFIVGNLIVIFLVGESKFITSKSKADNYSDICYDKFKCKITKPRVSSPKKAKKGRGHTACPLELYDEEKIVEIRSDEEMLIKCCKGDVRMFEKLKLESLEMGYDEESLPAEELNKLADDFIARVNRQRKLEAEFSRR
ncbi:hypothetical protein QVD17_10859 [Tagetes erecta]|uniref:DUF4408 domain-containing protein n=1 Tax=Tagetes erecta TaxID=13708 RepID=A0AAD8L7D1_TARER|nr:hypothetical protein QVD17_10859 [Tagetes erecta]